MFDQAKADRICERLAKGESLRKAAEAEDESHSTVLYWEATRPEFADQYARARKIGYALLAEELIEIADGATDWQRDRLRLDTRKWLLSKMLPKVYGDKLDLNHSGSVQFTKIESVVIDPKDGK
jgi:hypothetical protein